MSTPDWNLSAVIVFGVVGTACASRAEAPIEAIAQEETAPPAASASTPTAANLVRGRVVDASTGQGLPYIKVWLYESGENAGDAVLTDREGRFEIPRTGERLRLRFRDALTSKTLGGMPVPASPEEVVFEAKVGPTLLVRVSGAPKESMDWSVRLFEPGVSPSYRVGTQTRTDELERLAFAQPTERYVPRGRVAVTLPLQPDRAQPGAWSWCSARLEPDGVLVARYAKSELTPTPGRTLRIQIVESEEVWQGEGEIDSVSGVISAEIHVAPVQAMLSGSVMDVDSNAVLGDVVAFPSGPRDSSSPASVVSTRFDGTWRMKDLAPGPMRVLVFSENRSVGHADVELELGTDTPLEFVLPRAPSAADVNGALLAPAHGADPEGIVCLESTAQDGAWSPRPWVQAKLSTAGRALFSFDDVQQIEHRVHVLALDGRSYAPTSPTVAPGGSIEFTTEQPECPFSWTSYDLSLRDSYTHQELRSGSFLLAIGPVWCGSVIHGDPLQSLARLGEDAPVALLIGHPDHQPALLRLPEALRAARREDGRVDVVLELQRGHGAGLIVLDAEHAPRAFLNPSKRGDWTHSSRWNWSRLDEFLPMRGLQGAKIVSRGRVVGTSDELGVALCASDEPIRRFEVLLDGWTMVDVKGFRGDEEVSPCLGYVFMVRD
jgi:hypothetical protein